MTVGQLFKHTVGLNPAGVALRYKEDDVWRDINYLNYYDLVITAAKAFIKVRKVGDALPISYTYAIIAWCGRVPWCVHHRIQLPRVDDC